MAKTLELVFNATTGPTKLSIRNPKNGLTPLEIKTAMNELIQANVFTSSKGNFESINSARYVDRSTEDIVLP